MLKLISLSIFLLFPIASKAEGQARGNPLALAVPPPPASLFTNDSTSLPIRATANVLKRTLATPLTGAGTNLAGTGTSVAGAGGATGSTEQRLANFKSEDLSSIEVTVVGIDSAILRIPIKTTASLSIKSGVDAVRFKSILVRDKTVSVIMGRSFDVEIEQQNVVLKTVCNRKSRCVQNIAYSSGIGSPDFYMTNPNIVEVKTETSARNPAAMNNPGMIYGGNSQNAGSTANNGSSPNSTNSNIRAY